MTASTYWFGLLVSALLFGSCGYCASGILLPGDIEHTLGAFAAELGVE